MPARYAAKPIAISRRGDERMRNSIYRRSRSLPRLAALPALELVEQLVLLLLGHRLATGRLLPFFDEAREDRSQVLRVDGRHRRVALQPLRGRREADEAG